MAVIFEVSPTDGRRDRYLDVARWCNLASRRETRALGRAFVFKDYWLRAARAAAVAV